MSVFSRAVQTVTSALRGRGGSPTLYAPNGLGGFYTVFQSGGRASGQISLTEGERLQANTGVVHVAVNRIAEDISSLKVSVEVYKRGGKWVEDEAHPLAQLLAHPCAAHDGTELRHVLQQHVSLLGRMSLLVVDGTHGEPRELHILYPHLLDAIPDPLEFVNLYRYRTLNGNMLYWPAFKAKPDKGGVTVLEGRIPDPVNPYAGSSSVQAGSNSIRLDEEVRAYARFYFANNAMPGAVLESDQPYPGVDAAKAQKESWNENYQGMYNAGKIAPLWGGLKLKTISPPFKDLAFPEITKATRQDILMHFGVPGPVVGYTDTGALGADTFSAAKAVYQSQTLDPHRKRLERFLNRLAARWPGCRVVIESPVEEDIKGMEERQLKEAQAGLISREEYRNARGYEPDGQPAIWTVPGSTRVLHGLTPEDTASTPLTPDTPPPADPEAQKQRAALIRSLWAGEYRMLKADPDTPLDMLNARWQAELPELASVAPVLRQRALSAVSGNRVLAYEALKAEARALAQLGEMA